MLEARSVRYLPSQTPLKVGLATCPGFLFGRELLKSPGRRGESLLQQQQDQFLGAVEMAGSGGVPCPGGNAAGADSSADSEVVTPLGATWGLVSSHTDLKA